MTVDRVTIIRDNVTGRSRGFGFVLFEDSSAFAAVLKRKHMLDGRKVRCTGTHAFFLFSLDCLATPAHLYPRVVYFGLVPISFSTHSAIHVK